MRGEGRGGKKRPQSSAGGAASAGPSALTGEGRLGRGLSKPIRRSEVRRNFVGRKAHRLPVSMPQPAHHKWGSTAPL